MVPRPEEKQTATARTIAVNSSKNSLNVCPSSSMYHRKTSNFLTLLSQWDLEVVPEIGFYKQDYRRIVTDP